MGEASSDFFSAEKITFILLIMYINMHGQSYTYLDHEPKNSRLKQLFRKVRDRYGRGVDGDIKEIDNPTPKMIKILTLIRINDQ